MLVRSPAAGIAGEVMGDLVIKQRALRVAGLPLQFVDTLLHDLAGNLRRPELSGNVGFQVGVDNRVGDR